MLLSRKEHIWYEYDFAFLMSFLRFMYIINTIFIFTYKVHGSCGINRGAYKLIQIPKIIKKNNIHKFFFFFLLIVIYTIRLAK
jgi:hypothetical protein